MRPPLSPVLAAVLALAAAAPAAAGPAQALVAAQLGGMPTSPAFKMGLNKNKAGAPEATAVGAMPIESREPAKDEKAKDEKAAKDGKGTKDEKPAKDAHGAEGHGAKEARDDKPAKAGPPAQEHAAKDAPAHGDPHEAHAADAPASAPRAKPAGLTMDALRERLAEKLGATPSKDNRYVMKVSNRGETGENVITATRGGAARRTGAAVEARARKAGAASAPGGAEAAAAHGGLSLLPTGWDYAGANGPESWGRLGYDKCASGSRQSPIDIRGGIAVDLEPIRFDYRPSAFSVVDNGHTVEVDVEPGNAITVTGRRYELQQFHFHRPSEERIDGRQFDMVAHLVHKDPDGKLAVVAVLLDRGSAQALVQTVWNNLPLEKHEVVKADVKIDLAELLPKDRRYYTYMGSLTTPPCSEGVLWMVMKQPVPISPEQLSIFARLYPMNARPVQQADGRLIKQSN